MIPPRRGLGIFYKEPAPGRVKTRLSPPLRESEAAALYAAFLADTIRMVAAVPLDLVILFDAGESPGWRPGAPSSWPHRLQRGHNLGDRMSAALRELHDHLAPGPSGVCLIGSDAPLLGASVLDSAFSALAAGADLVTSPTPDGGYGLIGVSRPPRADLLDGIAWSSPTVLQETEAAARRGGWTPARALPSQDIDTVADLSEFLTKLCTETGTGSACPAPATRKYLQELTATGRLSGQP